MHRRVLTCCVRSACSATRNLSSGASSSVNPAVSFEPTKECRQQRQQQPVAPRRYMGQPSHTTHSHLLQIGELMPGIHISEFSLRRQRLFDRVLASIRDTPAGSGLDLDSLSLLIVIPAARVQYAAPDVPYRFRQDSNFLYLTGFTEPDSCLVIHRRAGTSEPKSTLFVASHDPHRELWDGPRPGTQGALALTGVDETQTRDRMRAFCDDFVNSVPANSCFVCVDPAALQNRTEQIYLQHAALNNEIILTKTTPKQFIHELRWIKSKSEQQLIRHTVQIGAAAVARVMQTTRPGMNERELVGRMELEARQRGAQQLAYPPVVASAHRANIIHYMNADQTIEHDDLILMDAGVDYFGYVSDITRTWPANGRYNGAALTLYDAMWDVHTELLCIVNEERPLTLNSLLTRQLELLAAKFVQLGLLTEDDLCNLDRVNQLVHKYCPHHVSHYLGMDVHDTDTIERTRPLRDGVLITVEPGIYIPHDDETAPEEFRGIGIRIEDDVLITDTGCEVLSESCPRSVQDTHALLHQTS